MRDRFGNLAVFGGEPAPRMMRRMLFCDRVVHAYTSYKAEKDGAKWAEQNPDANELLTWVMKVANGE